MDGFTREFTETESGLIWTAGTMLERYLQDHESAAFNGKTVLELGSGLGRLGLVLDRLNARVICTEHPASVEKLRHALDNTDIQVQALLWGRISDLDSLPPIDIMVGSEIIYDPEFHDDLITTLVELVRRNPKAIYYNAFADRPFSCMFFAKASDAGLEISEVTVDYDRLGLERDRVAIHQLRLKNSS